MPQTGASCCDTFLLAVVRENLLCVTAVAVGARARGEDNFRDVSKIYVLKWYPGRAGECFWWSISIHGILVYCP